MINFNQINRTTPPIMEKQVGSVPVPANCGRVYSKEILGNIELFWKNATGQEVQITSNGTLVLPSIPSLVPAGGTVNQVLAKQSSTNYAMAWKSVESILKEFKFVMPAGADLASRLLGLTVTGLELDTAFDHTPSETQFGTSQNTLVIAPTGLSNIILSEVSIFQITNTGLLSDYGISKIVFESFKTNTDKSKSALLNVGTLLDTAKDYVIYIRFI